MSNGRLDLDRGDRVRRTISPLDAAPGAATSLDSDEPSTATAGPGKEKARGMLRAAGCRNVEIGRLPPDFQNRYCIVTKD
jgi:hypothetical protein